MAHLSLTSYLHLPQIFIFCTIYISNKAFVFIAYLVFLQQFIIWITFTFQQIHFTSPPKLHFLVQLYFSNFILFEQHFVRFDVLAQWKMTEIGEFIDFLTRHLITLRRWSLNIYSVFTTMKNPLLYQQKGVRKGKSSWKHLECLHYSTNNSPNNCQMIGKRK